MKSGGLEVANLVALLGLAAAAAIMGSVTRSLRGLAAELKKLTAGDHAARASATGQVREVAGLVNALADEGDRLRAQEAEAARLRNVVREAGLAVQEHAGVDDLLLEAKAAIEKCGLADVAYLHVMQDALLGQPAGHDWVLPDGLLGVVRGEGQQLLRDLLQRNASMVTADLASPEGNGVPPHTRDQLVAAGIASQVLVPFG